MLSCSASVLHLSFQHHHHLLSGLRVQSFVVHCFFSNVYCVLCGGCPAKRTGVRSTCGPISPYSGRDCVKSLQSSYTGLYPQSLGLGLKGLEFRGRGVEFERACVSAVWNSTITAIIMAKGSALYCIS